MESQSQNPEFNINPETFTHAIKTFGIVISNMMNVLGCAIKSNMLMWLFYKI